MDIARSEQVESELDAMIRRRDTHRRQTEGERLIEELYEPSVRAWRERQEAENRAAWRVFHEGQAARHRATLETLATYHEREAAKLRRDDVAVEGGGGIGS